MNSCSQMQSFLSTVEESAKIYAENYFSEKFHVYAQALGQHFQCSVDDIMQICEQAEPMANVSKEENMNLPRVIKDNVSTKFAMEIKQACLCGWAVVN